MTTEASIYRNNRCDNVHTQVPKLNQFSTYVFHAGWTVVYTAIAMEAKNPSTEHERAMYLGRVAVYRFCVSSVAMPSSSLYNLEVSLGALSLTFDVALLENIMNVGIEVQKTNINAIKAAMEEGLGEGSIRDGEMMTRPGTREHVFMLQVFRSNRLGTPEFNVCSY